MASNIDKFSDDFKKLKNLGQMLEYSMYSKLKPKEFDDFIQSSFPVKNERDSFVKKLPEFSQEYENWYSQSKALIKQIFPDRFEDFVCLYEKPKNRKDLSFETYTMQDYQIGLQATRGYQKEVVVDQQAGLSKFKQQYRIFLAVEGRLKSSLFDIEKMMQADLLDSEIGAAKELLKHKFYRAAGVIIGVVLEKHLKQVCTDHEIKVTKKNPTLSELNELLKSNGVIEIPQWRHITLLADLRNLCAHNKDVEPTKENAEDLIAGADKVIKTVF